MKRLHRMPFGATLAVDGGALFRLWAPAALRVDLVRSAGPDAGELPMRSLADGWFELAVARADAQTRYAYRINGGLVIPDPASRWNPGDVHAASALIDPLAFDWPDDAWHGRPWHEAVIYELHVGCFTPEGDFSAVIDRLDDLVTLGVTAIELMPVADFPGHRSWGYDGVLPFAPDASYGTPDDLKRMVAAAHQRGLMVLLDVVYNHFGPEGNYLEVYAPAFFNPGAPTPWGKAINFDGAGNRPVRDFLIHNVLYWLEEFHLDGLRIDAVHAIRDLSTPNFIDELAQAVRTGPGRERYVHLVLENDANDAQPIGRYANGQPLVANAQWNDDLHHALHVLATGETDGYYRDFATDPLRLFGRALAEGFAFQGESSAYRAGAPRGTVSRHLTPLAFVNFTQTHDQIGNRAFGERIGTLAAALGREDALRTLVACTLLAPSPPLLFMGEEYAASTPFQYFCDFKGELARAVTEGRLKQFNHGEFSDPARRQLIPDPNAESTFLCSKLDWSQRLREPHANWLSLYTDLLRLRREKLFPWLDGAQGGEFTLQTAGTLRITWPLGSGRRWHMLAQLADSEVRLNLACTLSGDTVYRSHSIQGLLPGWSVQVAIETI